MSATRAFCACLFVVLLGACSGSPDSRNELPVKCVDRPDPGTCDGQLPRFWYDYQTDSCRMFHYGGCGGHVPFETREACEALCLAKRR